MIETDKRKAAFLLHQEGHSVREIARLLSLSRNTVRTIIVQGGARPKPHPRADKLALDEELLRRLHQQCQGHIARVHEKLVEEEGVALAYSTLTQRLLDYTRERIHLSQFFSNLDAIAHDELVELRYAHCRENAGDCNHDHHLDERDAVVSPALPVEHLSRAGPLAAARSGDRRRGS